MHEYMKACTQCLYDTKAQACTWKVMMKRKTIGLRPLWHQDDENSMCKTTNYKAPGHREQLRVRLPCINPWGIRKSMCKTTGYKAPGYQKQIR
jgi:hypothetical protein